MVVVLFSSEQADPFLEFIIGFVDVQEKTVCRWNRRYKIFLHPQKLSPDLSLSGSESGEFIFLF